MWFAQNHGHFAPPLIVCVDDRPGLRGLSAGAPHQSQRSPEALGQLALSLVVLGLGLLEGAPHPQQVIAEPVISRKQLWLLLGRADELLDSMLEGRLHTLLPVRAVRRPGLLLRQPHALA